MQAKATPTDPVLRWAARRAAANRANSQHSTGPRSEAGKRHSSQNAIRHGLTAKTAVIPSEDLAAYEKHRREFLDEYQPADPSETQLVHELADTAWRLNRIPLVEADLLSGSLQPKSRKQSLIDELSKLGLYSSRLSRQYQKTLDKLRDIQAERRHRERRELRDAADLLVHHQHKGIPWDPADHGFVFSKEQVERHAQRLMRQKEARFAGYVRFDLDPHLARPYLTATASSST